MAKSKRTRNKKRKMTRRRGGNPPHAPPSAMSRRAASPSPKGMMSVTTLTKPIRPQNHYDLVKMTHDAQKDAFEYGLKYLKTIYESNAETAEDITWCNSRPECFHTLVHNFTNSDNNTFSIIGKNPQGLTKQEMIDLIHTVFRDHHDMLARLIAELDILLKNKNNCWEFFFGRPGLPGVCRLGYHDPANKMFDLKAQQQRQQEAELLRKKSIKQKIE